MSNSWFLKIPNTYTTWTFSGCSAARLVDGVTSLLQMSLVPWNPGDVIFFVYIQFCIVLLAWGHPPNEDHSKSRNAEEIRKLRDISQKFLT
jgi:hypothetical protein